MSDLYDHALEHRLIGNLFVRPDLIDDLAIAGLTPDDFHDLQARAVWTVLPEGVNPYGISLMLNGNGPNLATLALWEAEADKTAYAPSEARTLKAMSERRRLRAMADRMLQLSDGQGTADEIRSTALAYLGGLPATSEDDELWTAAELYELTLPTSPWLLPGLLLGGGLNLVAGEVASGKSWLMLDALLAAASGGSAWGQSFASEVPSLYLGCDNAWNTVADRVQSLCRGRGISGPAGLTVYDKPLNLAEASGVRKLERLIDRTGARLIALDVLARYMVGVDENSAGEVAPVLTGLRQLANAHGCAFLIAHHLNKGRGLGAILERIRGSIDIAGSVDVAFLLTVEGEGFLAKRTLRQRKNRHAEEAPAVTFEIVPGTSGLVLAFDRPGSTPAMGQRRQEILTSLEVSGPSSTRELRKVVGGRPVAVELALKELQAEGLVNCVPGPRGAKVWSLP